MVGEHKQPGASCALQPPQEISCRVLPGHAGLCPWSPQSTYSGSPAFRVLPWECVSCCCALTWGMHLQIREPCSNSVGMCSWGSIPLHVWFRAWPTSVENSYGNSLLCTCWCLSALGIPRQTCVPGWEPAMSHVSPGSGRGPTLWDSSNICFWWRIKSTVLGHPGKAAATTKTFIFTKFTNSILYRIIEK